LQSFPTRRSSDLERGRGPGSFLWLRYSTQNLDTAKRNATLLSAAWASPRLDREPWDIVLPSDLRRRGVSCAESVGLRCRPRNDCGRASKYVSGLLRERVANCEALLYYGY